MLAVDETLDGVRYAFTDRLGGGSSDPYAATNLALHTGDAGQRVHANRELLARRVGVHARDLVFADQVHGRRVRRVQRRSRRTWDQGVPRTDGLVTTTRGLALVILGADCLPVLLWSEGVVGAAHVGRAGLALRVLDEVVATMRVAGAGPIAARIGPGICGRCYEVPDALAAEVEQTAPGSRSTTRSGRASIDLAAGARRQLADAGVDDVGLLGACTYEQPDRWYSYRRAGVTGRHAGVVLLR